MNFGDCVLRFIFFMCSLVETMDIHKYCVSGSTLDHFWPAWSLVFMYEYYRSLSIFIYAL